MTEVLSRLVAIETACRWSEVPTTDASTASGQLAGWAAAHLAVVVERGCACAAMAEHLEVA